MSNEIATIQDMDFMAKKMAKLFQKTPDDLFSLMLVARAEGKDPAIAAMEYDIIQGRPSLKSTAALSRFQAAGGAIQWVERTDLKCIAKFTHPQGGTLPVMWDIERAKTAGLTSKDNWKKYPAQMLSARVISEGVRAVYPACLGGFYLSEEVKDFDEKPTRTKEPRNVTGTGETIDLTPLEPEAPTIPPEPLPPKKTVEDEDLIDRMLAAKKQGIETLKPMIDKAGKSWKGADRAQRLSMVEAIEKQVKLHIEPEQIQEPAPEPTPVPEIYTTPEDVAKVFDGEVVDKDPLAIF